MGIVDNKWATVGSANLDGFSLSSSPYIPLLVAGREQMRAIEANAVFFNGVADQPASDLPEFEFVARCGPNTLAIPMRTILT